MVGVSDSLTAYWMGLRDKPEALAEKKKHLFPEDECPECGETRLKVGRSSEHRLITCLNPACSKYADIDWVY